MGIHGLFGQIGPGQRISLAKLSADHYAKHSRPLRVAIDISIWLFQIQSGKGGSNPALRTFYYRLLRLLSLNIWPLFVFDGPNKPLWKRNKKVGGPGVRVVSVPEFLAKQLLKHFGFPWHIAPGEAEAECALLQRENVVDAVLSEDVDTLMFGSEVTLKNWTPEGSGKTPTHVNVYRAEDTKAKSGLDPEGMILVALMSGGDYLPTGIAGCGPKLASDAARAGFGRDLCGLSRRDAEGLKSWRERLKHEIRTNESKFFSRRNTNFTIPDDFPNLEVLGYYTHPCVSTPEKVAKLRQELAWDLEIDFQELRTFTADAFDWRCKGGAKKFIKNLAPALLLRELRLNDCKEDDLDARGRKEKELIHAIHGKRNHYTTGGELEYRITFTPHPFVPIDLSIEDEDDEFLPAGGADDESDAEADELLLLPSSTPVAEEAETNAPKPKQRTFRPYDPAQPEKLWILRTFLRIGCPLFVEDYEAPCQDPREFLRARRKAKEANAGAKKKAQRGTAKEKAVPENSLMRYAKVTKALQTEEKGPAALKDLTIEQTNGRSRALDAPDVSDDSKTTLFRLPTTQIPAGLLDDDPATLISSKPLVTGIEVLDLATTPAVVGEPRALIPPPRATSARPFAAFAKPKKTNEKQKQSKTSNQEQVQKTPRRNKKRPQPEISSPAMSQRTIISFYSPSPRKAQSKIRPAGQEASIDEEGAIDLTSSSPAPVERSTTPTPPSSRRRSTPSPVRERQPLAFSPGKLPDTITKRRKKTPLKRWQTAPASVLQFVDGQESDNEEMVSPLPMSRSREVTPVRQDMQAARGISEVMDLISPSPVRSDRSFPSPVVFRTKRAADLDLDATPRVSQSHGAEAASLLPSVTANEVDHSLDWWFNGVTGGQRIENQVTRNHLPSLQPAISIEDDDEFPELPAAFMKPKNKISQAQKDRPPPSKQSTTSSQPLRPSPRHTNTTKKKRIQLRDSLEGWWKEVESVDPSGDTPNVSRADRSTKTGWRKSEVEVLDMTEV